MPQLANDASRCNISGINDSTFFPKGLPEISNTTGLIEALADLPIAGLGMDVGMTAATGRSVDERQDHGLHLRHRLARAAVVYAGTLTSLARFLDDGRIYLSNNAAEGELRHRPAAFDRVIRRT